MLPAYTARMNRRLSTVVAAVVGWVATTAYADALTPIGADPKAEQGPHGLSIPPWDGGWVNTGGGDELTDLEAPHADDEPLFTINAKNVEQYAELLSAGQRALFKTYPDSYYMQVYPSRRTAALPAEVQAQSLANRDSVTLINEGSGLEGASAGVPFPVPENGVEAMWNHVARYRTTGFQGFVNHAVTTKSGAYVIERQYLEIVFGYNNPVMAEAVDKPMIGWIMTKLVAPANKVGDAYLLHVPLDRSEHDTLVWVYNQGTRKVRRIGEVGYDNPARDGLITQDQIDMFNGPFDRYHFNLKGKRMMLVPYNTEALHDKDLEYDELIQPGHIDPEHVRYELHRMWVVEAQLREGAGHVYSKRVFYLDEDSWLILLQDMYDARGEFWRYAESYARQYPQIPLLVNAMQTHYDLQSRRYVILNMTNEEEDPMEYDVQKPQSHFTTSALRRFASQRHR